MKNLTKSVLCAITAMGLVIGASSSPALANASSGGLAITSAKFNSKDKSQLITMAVSIRDEDGITASRLTCTNPSGREVFSLSFRLDARSNAEYKSRAGTRDVPLSGVTSTVLPRFDFLKSSSNFSVSFQGKWRIDDQCMANLTVTDRLGSTASVISIPVTFREYSDPSMNSAIQPPASQPGKAETRKKYKPDGVRNVFGCLLTGEDGSRVPDGLPYLYEDMSCSEINRSIAGMDNWSPLYPPGELTAYQSELFSWRLSFGDIRSMVCRYTYDPRVEKYRITDARTDARALCSFARNYDSRIKTKVQKVREPSPYGARLSLDLVFRTR